MRQRLPLIGALLLVTVGPAACVAAGSGSTVPAATAATVDLRKLEGDILLELNAARTAPATYAGRIEALLQHMEGRILRRPGDVAIATQEGSAAVREAAAALRATPRLASLAMAAGMQRAARDHAVDQGARGATGHRGSDGSTTSDQVNRHGRWTGRLTESISYGPAAGAAVVQGLIVDDGVPDRGHRRNLLDSEVTVAGVGCAVHATYRVTCVIDLAAGFQPR